MKKKVLIVLVCLSVLAVVASFVLKNREPSPQFKTERVLRGQISQSVTASGTLSPVTTVIVGTQVSGTIKEIYVDFNSPVKKGQLIALIDPEQFQAQLNQAKANLSQAKANLLRSQVSLSDAERNYQRYKTLMEKELIARSDFDTALTNYESAKAQVELAKAQVSQAEATLRVAEINLAHTRIVSPVNGVVVSRNVDVGQTVAASFQTPTLFSIAQDLTKMKVVSSVVEADIGMVKEGQEVEFTVDAYREHTFKGKVSEVRIAPITVQNVVTYEVIILVDNPEHKLKPGMTANVSIIVASKQDVLKVPNTALRFRMPEGVVKDESPQVRQQGQRDAKGKRPEPGQATVWLLKDGKPKRVTFKTGLSDGQFTEVISEELSEGDEVIVQYISKKKTDGPQRPTRPQQSGPRMF